MLIAYPKNPKDNQRKSVVRYLPGLLGRQDPEELSDGADRRPDDRRCAVAAVRRAGAAPDAGEAMVLQERWVRANGGREKRTTCHFLFGFGTWEF